MDLSTLLAREGIEAGELDAILKWARHRAAALVARIEPGSPLAEALGPALERSRDGNAVPVPHPAQRSAPRPIARAVSKPHLGAAVQAALSGKQEDLDLALETAAAAEAESEAVVAVAAESAGSELPVLEDSPPPAAEPELDDNDPSIGGFNRFAFSFRRREAEKVAAEESRSSLTLTRDFETHAEETASSGEWNADAIELPEPPSFEAKRSTFRRGPEADLGDGEASGLLVLGIPDEEGIDVPVPRPRPSSARFDSRENSAPHVVSSVPAALARAQAEAREPSHPQSSTRALQPILDDEDSFDLGLDNLETDPVAARPISSPQPSAPIDSQPDSQPSGPQPSAQRVDSGPQRVDSGPQRMDSDPQRADSGPQRADSGPQAPRMQGSGPHGPPPPPPPRPVSSPAPAANKTQSLRSLPPPPPREAKRNGRPPPAPAAVVKAKPAKAEPTPAPGKRGGKRKKVVELSQPVARPVSAPMAAATAPSERSGQRPIPAHDEVLPRRSAVPDYLRDDDE